ncbi:MAG: 3-hydroxyacyl-ACP dehydratase FabZ [Candidatus Brocadiia bacterium]
MKLKLRTIGKRVEADGVGLHSGIPAHIALVPVPEEGIFFTRTDIFGSPVFPLHAANYRRSGRSSAVGDDKVAVGTVEHLTAAFFALGITGVRVECDGPELPAADGSAAFFVSLIDSAGIVDTPHSVEVFSPFETVTVTEGANAIVVIPGEAGLNISYRLDLSQSGLGEQNVEFTITEEIFRKSIAPARTFVPLAEVERLRAAGFGKGATSENTLVLGDPASRERFPNEAAAHKVLDILGDMAALGHPLNARIIAVRTGHSQNISAMERLAVQLASWLNDNRGLFDVKVIMSLLPHRYPFLLVDRVVEFECRKRIVGIKNVTINEEFFVGHFPGEPVMPGVLQVEAMAQTAGMMMLNPAAPAEYLAYLMSLDKVKFRKPVVPGDRLVITAEMLKERGRIGQVAARIEVDGRIVSEAEIMFSIVPRNPGR